MEIFNIKELGALTSISKERVDKLKEIYSTLYEKEPEFLSRASGRVNIIGEHIDYCGYGVLPMAIEQDILMLFSPNQSCTDISLKNTDAKYPDFTCDITKFMIDKSIPKWYNYILCGFQGIVEGLATKPIVGVDILVDGQIPCNAGLSSSSALVCCSAMVAMLICNMRLSRLELAEICQKCERYVGTEGGGMDQTICFMAEKGKAKYVQFNPLRTESIILPPGAVFVVANSLVEMNKSATDHFNIRVAECRLATQVLAAKLGLNWKQFRKLFEIQDHFHWTFAECLAQVDKHLKREPFSKQDVCLVLDCTSEVLEAESLSERSKTCNIFKLHNRATHVYSEAERVIKFKDLCGQSGDSTSDSPDQSECSVKKSRQSDGSAKNSRQSDGSAKNSGQSDGSAKNSSLSDGSAKNSAQSDLLELGRLMNESHESCRVMYECSCEQLDQLVKHSISSGALGCRLTGAGWGGCTVSMVAHDQLSHFMANMKKYYLDLDIAESVVHSALFSTFPSNGAAILKF